MGGGGGEEKIKSGKKVSETSTSIVVDTLQASWFEMPPIKRRSSLILE